MMKSCSVRQSANVWPWRPGIAFMMMLLMPHSSVAQDYPEKTIRYIVPAAPGGPRRRQRPIGTLIGAENVGGVRQASDRG